MRKSKGKVKYKLHKAALCLCLTLLLFHSFGARCEAAQTTEDELTDGKIDGILDRFGSLVSDELGEDVSAEGISERLGIKRILEQIINAFMGKGSEVSSFLLTLLGMALILSLVSQLQGELGGAVLGSVSVIVSYVLFDRMSFLIGEAQESLSGISSFFGSVIPVALSVNSLGVTPTTASTQALGMGITLSAYSFIGEEVLAAFVGVLFVLSAASSIDPMFSRLSKSVRNILLFITGILTALIGATFSLQNTISASADSALVRSARYAISSSIPIVGSSVSGALGIAASGVSYARGIVGGGAIAVIISLMTAPLITILIYRLSVRAGILFGELSSNESFTRVLAPFSDALDALLAVYSLTSVIYIVELAVFLKGGTGLA